MFAAVILSVVFIPLGVRAQEEPGWYQDENGWWYIDEYGEQPQDCIRYVHGEKYYFDEYGYIQSGWIEIDNKLYYFDESGAMANSGWKDVYGDYYYFNGDGRYEKSWVIDNYYLDENGVWDTTPGWKYDSSIDEWRYVNSKGYAPRNEWMLIDGKYYFFEAWGGAMTKNCVIDEYFVNSNGQWDATEGWKTMPYFTDESERIWYYVESNGKVASTKWKTIGGCDYFFKPDGVMAKSSSPDGYYVDESGKYDSTPGWKYDKSMDRWFYVGSNGKVVQGQWKVIGGKNYYFDKWDGVMAKGEVVDRYFLNDQGVWDSTKGWKHCEDGEWFYVDGNGRAMSDEWKKINGTDYFFYEYGAMANDVIIDKYYINSSGAWDGKPGWKKIEYDDIDECNWYYVDGSGKVVNDVWKKINGTDYYFYDNGAMATNGVVDGYFIDGSGAWDSTPGWKAVNYVESDGEGSFEMYYVKENGKAVCDEMIQIDGYYYYFDIWGLMQKNTYINGDYADEYGILRQ